MNLSSEQECCIGLGIIKCANLLNKPVVLVLSCFLFVSRCKEVTNLITICVLQGVGGLCGEEEVRTVAVSGGGSLRIQHLTGVSPNNEGKSRFPKLEDCAHFHYDNVDLAPLQVR